MVTHNRGFDPYRGAIRREVWYHIERELLTGGRADEWRKSGCKLWWDRGRP